MTAPQPLPSRLIGALFVERGLVSESQIRIALEIQNETGQQLGQVLVERFGVSRKELASVVAEQWAKLGGSAGPEDTASWRRLGDIFVDRGFVTQEELDQALARQRQTGERLGEALVAQGVISKFELAGALAEQMAALEAAAAEEAAEGTAAEATVHHLPTRPDEPSETAAAPVLELVTSDQNGSEPSETVDPAAEETETRVAEEAPEHEPAEPAEPEEMDDEVHADVGTVVAEPAVGIMALLESPVGDVTLEEQPADDVALAEPAVEDVALLESPVGDVAPEEQPADDVALAEPAVEDVAVSDSPVGDVTLEEQPADDVALAEPAVEEVAFEEPVVEEVFAEAPMDAGWAEEPAADIVAAAACVAFAPTTRGYRLVPLGAVPAAGETIDVPDVGPRLVLRVGRSPYPLDDRICAFVEEPVVWALAVDAVH
jgi:hypothetical protein